MAYSIHLVRAYLRWPERGVHDALDAEVSAFTAWLGDTNPEVLGATNVDEISQLVASQREKSGARTAGRRESRIQENIQVLVNDGQGGSARARTLDTAMHGMRLVSEVGLNPDDVFLLTVAPSGFPITIYNLEAKARWLNTTDQGWSIGLEVQEVRDFDKWKLRFTGDEVNDQAAGDD